jgi:hypothetical protein
MPGSAGNDLLSSEKGGKGPAMVDIGRSAASDAAGRLSCNGRFAIAGVQKSAQGGNFQHRSFGFLSRLDHRRGKLIDRGSGLAAAAAIIVTWQAQTRAFRHA